MTFGISSGNGKRHQHHHHHHHPCSNVLGWLVMVLTVMIISQHHCRAEFRLSIIHNNDFHAHYLPVKNANNADCYENYETNPECVAGVARTVAKVKELRARKSKDHNVLFLNAGDHFQGTAWYTVMRSKVVSLFVNMMQHDVMTLGNHEFDDGPEELVKFLKNVTNQNGSNLPVVCSNIEVDPGSPLNGMFSKSVVLTLNGTKVAIIGYITPTTTHTSNPGKLVQFGDEIASIREEIQALKAKHPDLKIFIGLGHSGYDRDLEIAEAISDLDLIVGGHSHTFLFSSQNGSHPSAEIPMGPYPTVYRRRTKRSVFLKTKITLVVQAFAFGKYLGNLDMIFDDHGDIIQYQGAPILLDFQSATDPETQKLVKKLNDEMAAEFHKTYGHSLDELSIDNCRHQECAIGNLIAESFVEYFNRNRKPPKSSTCDLIAVINGGNIRTSIDRGPITYGQIVSTLPFRNSLGVLTINGSQLIKIYQHSAGQHDLGGFLQQSASIRAKYRVDGKSRTVVKKSTLVELKVRCQHKWIKVQEDGRIYSMIINNFLANQGDFYPINHEDWTDYQYSDSDLFTDYIKTHKNIRAKLDGRIMITNSSTPLRSRRVLYPLLILFLLAIFIIIMNIMEK